MRDDKQTHRVRVHAAKADAVLSWHEVAPARSLELAELSGIGTSPTVIDIDGNAAHLVNYLVENS